MTILSSRPNPPVSAGIPTQQDVLDAATPSIRIVEWLTSRMHFSDNSPTSVAAAADMIEEALECMELDDYAVQPLLFGGPQRITFDVAIKPFDIGAFVFFQVSFQVI